MSNRVIDKSVDLKHNSEFCYGVLGEGGGGPGDPLWTPRLLRKCKKYNVQKLNFGTFVLALYCFCVHNV